MMNDVPAKSKKLPMWLVLIGLGTIFLFTTSCMQHIRPQIARVELSDENIARQQRATVGFVRPTTAVQESSWEGPFCAGFFIDDRHLVSAAHCFQRNITVELVPGYIVTVPTIDNLVGEEVFFVQFREIRWMGAVTGSPTPGRITLWDRDNDIVIIEPTESDFHPMGFLPLSDEIPAIGSSVYHVGHPLGVGWTFLDGIVSNLVREDRQDSRLINLIQVNIALSPGSSGGSIVNSRGEVVGLANAIIGHGTTAHIGLCRSVSAIRRLLEQE
jgi:S1-C subfamily serine protease